MSKELVVDRVVKYLIDELNVPEDMIELDTPLDEYEEGVEGLLDITVVAEDEDGCLLPLMVIKCFDDEIELDESVIDACMDELELIDATTHVGRMVVTNGDQMMYADCNGTEIDDDTDIPTYEDMIEEYKAMEKEYNDYVAEHPDYEEEHSH